MIQLRYGPEESQIARIFNNQKILQEFEREYKKNEMLLRSKITEYKKYLFAKSEELKNFGKDILLTEEIVSTFREDIKLQILYQGINLIFTTGELNVEKNIIHLIKDEEIVKKAILNRRLVYVFESILRENEIPESETYEDMLMTKFVEKNDN